MLESSFVVEAALLALNVLEIEVIGIEVIELPVLGVRLASTLLLAEGVAVPLPLSSCPALVELSGGATRVE